MMRFFAFLIPLFILFFVEYVCFAQINSWAKSLGGSKGNWVKGIYIGLTVILWLFLLSFPKLRNITDPRWMRTVLSIIVMSVGLAKLAITLFSSLDIIVRFFSWLLSLFFTKESTPQVIKDGMSRHDFLRNISLLAGGFMMGLTVWGSTNRYRYKVHKVKVPLPNLPDAIKKLKIVQISDIHSGSFTSTEAVAAGVQRILDIQPDIIFFTGDLVNNLADEMRDYIQVFSKLKANYGVFSILGNHDYGDYYDWNGDSRRKSANLARLKEIHAEMGWRLLLNENLTLNIGGHSLGIVGVENIAGNGRFHSKGDFEKATAGLPSDTVANILLSHDPSHWDKEVKLHPIKMDLTLSGHTHGMQFGIEIPGIKWSPVQYFYKQWAGLYQEADRFIYVNRGFGFLGYPGRIGILPEITILELG